MGAFLNIGDGPSGSRPSLFADLGAYTGDTVKLFREIRGFGEDHIVAFEPEPRNFRKLSENLGSLENAELINAAAWDCDGEVFVEKGRGRGTRAERSGAVENKSEAVENGPAASRPGAVRTALRSLDSVLSGRRADFIKMDIEGAEHRAIPGAAQTIKTFRPAMLIAAYHRTGDLFEIPEAVLSIRPDYRLYLRKDPAIPAWGVNYLFI